MTTSFVAKRVWSSFPKYTEAEKADLRAISMMPGATEKERQARVDREIQIKMDSLWWRSSPYRDPNFARMQFSPRIQDKTCHDGKVRRNILYPAVTAEDIEECLARRRARGGAAAHNFVTCTLSEEELLRVVIPHLKANNNFVYELTDDDVSGAQ